jgi:apolipoprotein N-acyltransferase
MVIFILFMMFLALYPACAAALTAYARQGGITPLLTGPLAWAGAEWAKGWILTGFPWTPLGNSLTPALPLLQSAELWGTGGLSALIVLINALGARAALGVREKKSLGVPEAGVVALALALLFGGWWWGGQRLERIRAEAGVAPKMAVTVVQGDVNIYDMWNPAKRLDIVKSHVRLAQEAAASVRGRPWLVVWSESAAPFYMFAEARPTLPILEAARELGAYIFTGTMGTVRDGKKIRPSNRSWLVGPRGEDKGYYDKVHLVPFGEYVPFEDILSFVRAIAVIGENFSPGPKGHTLRAGQAVLGPLICYESIFPELARSQRLRGAELIVNQTNDAWFGRTAASEQHMSHLVLRCVENRMACARAANSGVSGFVEPDGSVYQTTKLYVKKTETRLLPLLKTATFYTRHGGLVGPYGLGLVFLLALGAGWRMRKTREVQDV